MSDVYAIVKFLSDETVDFVPTLWLEGRSNAYWPTKNVVKHRHDMTVPDEETWTLYPIKIYSFASKLFTIIK